MFLVDVVCIEVGTRGNLPMVTNPNLNPDPNLINPKHNTNRNPP